MEPTKLIAALEAATEGSEYLDYSIQRHFGLMKPVPLYSRSLDAAISLVPEGWSIHRLMQRNDCRGNFSGWMVELYRASQVVLELPYSLGATAPLALAAAALRARFTATQDDVIVGSDEGGDAAEASRIAESLQIAAVAKIG
jgi:hypothetical protein